MRIYIIRDPLKNIPNKPHEVVTFHHGGANRSSKLYRRQNVSRACCIGILAVWGLHQKDAIRAVIRQTGEPAAINTFLLVKCRAKTDVLLVG